MENRNWIKDKDRTCDGFGCRPGCPSPRDDAQGGSCDWVKEVHGRISIMTLMNPMSLRREMMRWTVRIPMVIWLNYAVYIMSMGPKFRVLQVFAKCIRDQCLKTRYMYVYLAGEGGDITQLIITCRFELQARLVA